MPSRLGIAAALALLAGCPHGDGHRGSRMVADDGLSVAIYTGDEALPDGYQQKEIMVMPPPEPPPPTVAGRQTRSVALVDDRRTVEVDGEGNMRMPDVAEGIELASLIVEALDGRELAVQSCDREGGLRGGWFDRPATFVTKDGVEVAGKVRSLGYDGEQPTWVIEDDDGNAHFIRGEPDRAILPGAATLEVRCKVRATAGKHRVRLAYATDDLSWRASYRVDVAVDGDAAVATVQPTFTVSGTALIGTRRAQVSLLVGLPGGDVTPRLAWHGGVDLGSDDVSVHPEPSTIEGTFEYVYRGALAHRDDNARQAYWRQSFTLDVWAGFGVGADAAAANTGLPAGPALVSVTRGGVTRQADTRWPEPDLDRPPGFTVPLWPVADLVGFRERRTTWDDGTRLTEQYLFSVSNLGDEPVTIWVEEELRTGGRRKITKAWPVKPERRKDLLRFPVKVAARKIERLGFEAEYRW